MTPQYRACHVMLGHLMRGARRHTQELAWLEADTVAGDIREANTGPEDGVQAVVEHRVERASSLNKRTLTSH